jgi:hypothetical protein
LQSSLTCSYYAKKKTKSVKKEIFTSEVTEEAERSLGSFSGKSSADEEVA